MPAYLLHVQFTLPQLQKVYETLMGVNLSKATFRRKVEAQGIVRRLRAMTPVVVPRATYWRNPADRELFLSGLRLAAGEGG